MKEQKATKAKELNHVIIRFAGDSGDGMQLTGSQFADTSAMLGNDISTFPDYPAEIRAPQGSTYGVSGFQVHIGHQEVRTPGDDSDIDVLVAMNPAALIKNISSITPGRTIIVDTDSFSRKNIEKAGYTSNPLEDGSLENYRLIEAPITSLTKEAIKHIGLDNKTMDRSKNMFALGMVFWMFTRPLDHTINYIETKFKHLPQVVEANVKTLKTGYNYALTLELLPTPYTILPAKMNKGTYRIIMGNQATAWGFIAAAQKTKLSLFLGSYPITPASDILHELTKHQGLGVTTFQAEDEIAGIGAAIGASFAGNLAITTTSGPGLALKAEAIGLALMTELPLVVVNVQRGGPSTGLPTKTEQSDLLQSMFGRNGDSPVIVVAASTSANSYDWAYEASRLALEHMTPVILLSDGYIANGSEPWKLRRLADMPDIKPNFVDLNEKDWLPYKRDEKTLVRKWAIPGMKGMEHRIGGLEKQEDTGNVSYLPKNHEKMVKIRAEKIQRVANYIPLQEIEGAQEGELLVVGWGGTYGSIHTALKEINQEEEKIGFIHFNYINPMPKNIKEVFSKFKKIIVCELNLGQMTILLRDRFPSQDFMKFNKIQGQPFNIKELVNKFNQILGTN